MFYSRLNRINKFYYELTLLFRQVAEVLYSPEGIALSALANASVPHDGFESVSGTAVVQSVRMSGTEALQSSSPQRCRFAPSCAQVVFHEETVLHEVRIGPYFLFGVAHHACVLGRETSVGVANLVFSCGPAWTVTTCAAYLGEEFLTLFKVIGESVSCSRDAHSAVPHHIVYIVGFLHFYRQVCGVAKGYNVFCWVACLVPLWVILIELACYVGVGSSKLPIFLGDVVRAEVVSRYVLHLPEASDITEARSRA